MNKNYVEIPRLSESPEAEVHLASEQENERPIGFFQMLRLDLLKASLDIEFWLRRKVLEIRDWRRSRKR